MLSAASAAQHLHAQGLLHGDVYGHNLQCTTEGHCVLGDMGAASFLPTHDVATAQALQRLEVRALGCLLEELLAHGEERENDQEAIAALTALCRQCLQHDGAARPLVAQVVVALAAQLHAPLNGCYQTHRFM
jgi:serine/threonine protein kinase